MLFKRLFNTCNGKLLTLLFWSSLYLLALKMSLYPSNTSFSVPKIRRSLRIYKNSFNNNTIQQETIVTKREAEESEEEMKLIFKARSQLMQDVCDSKPRPKETIKRNAFFIDFEHSLLWCSVFKAASSSWLHKFVVLGTGGNGPSNNKHIIDVTREIFPEPSKLQFLEALNDTGMTSFIIVRDPFVRILSAYRDKLERRALPFYSFISRFIVRNYRKKPQTLSTLRQVRPTFEEFVKYLIDPKTNVNELDEHWIPYSKYCTPCTINFTTIAKVETLDRDNKYIENKLGIDKLLNGQQTSKQAYANKSTDGQKTESLLKRYFKQLDLETLEKLIKVYEDDFELFGYDKTPYYCYVRKKPLI